MKLITGQTGVPHVTSSDDGSFNAAIWGDVAVLSNGKKFQYTELTNNSITIQDGDIVFQGRHARIERNGYDRLNLTSCSLGKFKNDLIVFRYTKQSNVETGELVVLSGAEVSSKTDVQDPSYTIGNIYGGDSLAEYPLYRIRHNGGNIEGVDRLFTPREEPLAGASSSIKFVMDATATPNTKYFLGTQTTVSFALPDNAGAGDEVLVVFYSGESSATLNITGNIIPFEYTPGGNSRSEISCQYDGRFWAILTNEMSVSNV